jgi:hypothetical protein
MTAKAELNYEDLKNFEKKMALLGAYRKDKKALGIAMSKSAKEGRARGGKILGKQLGLRVSDTKDENGNVIAKSPISQAIPLRVRKLTTGGNIGASIEAYRDKINAVRLPFKERFRTRKGKKIRAGIRVFAGKGEKKKLEPRAFVMPTGGKSDSKLPSVIMRRTGPGRNDIEPLQSDVKPLSVIEASGQKQAWIDYMQERMLKNTTQQVNRFYYVALKELRAKKRK